MLGALDDSADHALTSGVLTLVILVEEAMNILLDKLFPDLPEADP